MKRLIEEDAIRGMTSSDDLRNAIAAHPLRRGHRARSGGAARPGLQACVREVRGAADVFAPSRRAGGADGFVSIEVQPGSRATRRERSPRRGVESSGARPNSW